ncbi:MAG: 3'(2'),5'-bisphosphate nucleotidase CysQ [Gammaproteobacteria bacterium]|nr:3'(2'),5'-bisphosphate nucleotidase CysQ [Gammaproteobacteria bacterium]
MDIEQIQIEKIITIAQQAGAAILNIYDTDFSVYEKSDQSPLTEADLAAHQVIVNSLMELTPDIPILSEESAHIPYSLRSTWSRYWLIDPLDGTKEFVKRNGEFTVNIALIDNMRPVIGVIYVPVSKVSYYGNVGHGAFKILPGEEPEQIQATGNHGSPIRVAGSRSHAGESLKRYLENLGEHEIISMGSSLKSCLVAEGKADIYPRLGPTSEWDTGAAQAVVEAAGGRITDTSMQPLLYNSKDSLLNPDFFVFGNLDEDWSRYLE